MRVPQMVSDFFEWRWAPCVGLTAGSLSFVALALLLIPTRIAGEPRVTTTLSSFDNPQPQRALYTSNLARSLPEAEERRPDATHVPRSVHQPSPPSTEPGTAPRRGFSPIIDRPEPLPPAPVPVQAPVPIQAPVPVQAPVQVQTPVQVQAPVQVQVQPPAPTAAPPGSVVVIQPVPGGESREVTAQ